LSSSLAEPVTIEDLLQLVIEGHIPLSWYARHVPAQRVSQACILHFLDNPVRAFFNKNEEPKKYIGDVWWHGEWAYRAHAGLKPNDRLEPYANLGWRPIHESEIIEHIYGVYRLELEMCGALKEWLHSLLTNTGGELITLDGYFVSDAQGQIWRIMDRLPDREYTEPNGTLKKRKSPYYPSNEFPDPAEFVFQRTDIEAFEEQVAQGQQTASTDIGPREQQTLLNIIAGMLDLMLGKTPGGRPQSVFENQSAVIDGLLAHHDGKQGITKRTLEKKFARAKRGFTAD